MNGIVFSESNSATKALSVRNVSKKSHSSRIG